MTKYNYRVLRLDKTMESPEETLKSLGKEGWNLVSVDEGMAYLKKEIGGISEASAWHWRPQTEIGEKKVEAATDLVAGIASLGHRHRVVAIVDREGNVVRGKTDMVNGHEHVIQFVGMTEEADGHTHQFDGGSQG